MKFVYCLLFFIERTASMAVDTEKVEFCKKLECEKLGVNSVCGIRPEGEGFRLRLFENECEMMKYGCRVRDDDAYGIINLKYCIQTFENSRRNYDGIDKISDTSNDSSGNPCNKINCIHTGVNYLCGLRQEGEGFKIRLFFNECDLLKYNCENKLDFYTTDIRACKGLHRPNEPTFNISRNPEEIDDASSYAIKDNTLRELGELNKQDVENEIEKTDSEENEVSTNSDDSATTMGIETSVPYEVDLPIDYEDLIKDQTDETTSIQMTVPYETDMPIDYGDLATDVPTISTDAIKYINGVKVPKNLIVLDGGMLNYNGNINETMDNFFAATHVFDLPLKEVSNEAEALHESFRRMHMRIVAPVKVFKPWIEIPSNRSGMAEDVFHQPTLSSCFHKCPTVCPDTYAPVCGVPGIVAREPSLMFKNHCFMDAAQCKMRWEDKSETAESSSYIESSFMICLGDNMNGLYRFLPLIRTLQNMGRLKRRGKFHYKVRNMRFRSEFMTRESKPMG